MEACKSLLLPSLGEFNSQWSQNCTNAHSRKLLWSWEFRETLILPMLFFRKEKNQRCWYKSYVSLCKQKIPLISILWEFYSKEKDKAHVVYCSYFRVKEFYRFWKNELFIEIYMFFHWADIQFLENIFTQSNFIKSDMLCLFFVQKKKKWTLLLWIHSILQYS